VTRDAQHPHVGRIQDPLWRKAALDNVIDLDVLNPSAAPLADVKALMRTALLEQLAAEPKPSERARSRRVAQRVRRSGPPPASSFRATGVTGLLPVTPKPVRAVVVLHPSSMRPYERKSKSTMGRNAGGSRLTLRPAQAPLSLACCGLLVTRSH
jgi:hypothetical protein